MSRLARESGLRYSQLRLLSTGAKKSRPATTVLAREETGPCGKHSHQMSKQIDTKCYTWPSLASHASLMLLLHTFVERERGCSRDYKRVRAITTSSVSLLVNMCFLRGTNSGGVEISSVRFQYQRGRQFTSFQITAAFSRHAARQHVHHCAAGRLHDSWHGTTYILYMYMCLFCLCVMHWV